MVDDRRSTRPRLLVEVLPIFLPKVLTNLCGLLVKKQHRPPVIAFLSNANAKLSVSDRSICRQLSPILTAPVENRPREAGKTFLLQLTSKLPAIKQNISSQADFQAVLRTFNLAALSGPDGYVYSFDFVKGGNTYLGVAKPPPPRPPEPAVRNVTLRLDALAGRALVGNVAPYPLLTQSDLTEVLRVFEAPGLVQILPGEEPLAAAAAPERGWLRNVEQLQDNCVYLVVPAFGDTSLRDKARALGISASLPFPRVKRQAMSGCNCREAMLIL